MIAEAIHTILLAEPSITGALATYDFGAGAAPAIHTRDPIPVSSEHPAIIITETGGDNWDTFRGHKGGIMIANVRVYGDRSMSRKILRNLAQDIWEELHLSNLVVPGYDDVGTYCDMPAELEDPDGFPGFLIVVRSRILQS